MADPDPDLIERIRDGWADLVGKTGWLPVLILLLASTLCGLLIGGSHLGAVISVALTGAALLATVFRSTRRTPARVGVLAFVIVVAAVVARSAEQSPTGQAQAGWLAIAAYDVLVAMTLPLVLVRALQHRRVTVNTLCATVSAYLLLGLLFAGVYRLYDTVAPPFFAQDPGPAECARPDPSPRCPTPGQFSYFSFITLSTVGYGDLSPASDPARAFVTLEAIVGQVFVITALARVVSLLGEERPVRSRAGEPPD
jgi:hypothetical protein